MPFTFTWTNVDPADATPANLLGKDIRDLRAAIQERMDDQFCDPSAPWSASDPTNPIVVAPKILGNVTGKKLTLHHSSFIQTDLFAFSPLRTDLYVQNTSAAGGLGSPVQGPMTMMCGVVLPLGVTITGVSIMVDTRNGGSMAGTLIWNDYAAGAVVSHIASAIASGGAAGVAIATQAANLVVTGTMSILFKVVLNDANGNGSRLYGAQVTYTTPDCRNTL